VACRVVAAAQGEGIARAQAADVDPGRDVVLESPAAVGCAQGRVSVVSSVPGVEDYDVESDGPALFVTRDSYAPGWRATVDGAPSAVLRANGKHRAVAVPAGTHRVRLRYAPLHLPLALFVTAAAALAAAVIAVRVRRT
jgi:hypothetical protein